MTTPIDQIKSELSIIDLVAETYTVTGRGRVQTTAEHDSLKLWVDANTWYWYSRGVGGDVIDWYQHIHGCDFRTALVDLAQRAGVQLRPLTPDEQISRTDAAIRRTIYQIAANHYHRTLTSSPAAAQARHYCHTRGWTDAVIARHMLGYSGDNGTLPPEADPTLEPLSKQLQPYQNHPLAIAVLSIPPGHLIYIHRTRGIPTYLSARSITAKRHYNLPAAIQHDGVQVHAAGDRQLYHAQADTGSPYTILVEGQADAIACAELGHNAVALCGVGIAPLDGITHIAFDADEPGQAKALDAALAIDPLCKLFPWRQITVDAKDPADLLPAGVTRDDMRRLLHDAKPAIWHLAKRAGSEKDQEQRTALIGDFFRHYTALDDLIATDLHPDLAAQLCGGIGQFNRLLKAHQKQEEAGDNASPERYVHSAGGNKAGHLWEQCVTIQPDGTPKAAFAVRKPDGTIDTRAMLDIGNITYLPYPVDLGIIDAGVVLFPEQPADYGDMRQLVDDIQAFIHRYLDVDPFYEKLAAYYVIFTWMHDLFENLPYLRALGDYGTGKTRFLQAIGVLCYRPMFVSGASSVSPIFRLIDMFGGTLIIDEADFANSDAEAEIIKIMNVGYYRNGVVLRAEKDAASSNDQWSPQVYKVYGPKIMATRRPFADRATESRCLTKRMTTAKPRPEIPYILGPDFWRLATDIRNKLLKYRLDHHRPVQIDHSLADESVEPRLNQVTMALKSIVDPAMRGEIDTFVRAYNTALISDRQMTLPAIVVQALCNIHFDQRTNVLGEDTRDFSMKGISDTTRKLVADIDPDIKVHPRVISKILSDELGLNRRTRDKTTSRSRLDYTDDELFALMKRYGIVRNQ